MDPKPLAITLFPALNDLSGNSSKYEAELRKFDECLREHGLGPSASGLQFQARSRQIGPCLFVVKPPLSVSLPVLSVVLGAWLKGRHGRTIELEIDGAKQKAASIREVRAFLEFAREVRESNQPKRIIPCASRWSM